MEAVRYKLWSRMARALHLSLPWPGSSLQSPSIVRRRNSSFSSGESQVVLFHRTTSSCSAMVLTRGVFSYSRRAGLPSTDLPCPTFGWDLLWMQDYICSVHVHLYNTPRWEGLFFFTFQLDSKPQLDLVHEVVCVRVCTLTDFGRHSSKWTYSF